MVCILIVLIVDLYMFDLLRFGACAYKMYFVVA